MGRSGSVRITSRPAVSHHPLVLIPMSANGRIDGLSRISAPGHFHRSAAATRAVTTMTGAPRKKTIGRVGEREAGQHQGDGQEPGPPGPDQVGQETDTEHPPEQRREHQERDEDVQRRRRIQHVAELDQVRAVQLAGKIEPVAMHPRPRRIEVAAEIGAPIGAAPVQEREPDDQLGDDRQDGDPHEGQDRPSRDGASQDHGIGLEPPFGRLPERHAAEDPARAASAFGQRSMAASDQATSTIATQMNDAT